MRSPVDAFGWLDAWMIGSMRRYGILALRVSLGVVFVWFGALKVIGESPVEELILATVYGVPEGAFLIGLGVWEVVIGLGLLFAVALRTTLFLFFLQILGTFSVLVVRPDIAFQGLNPFLLTTEGEFVIKNLVLLSAGFVVGGTVHRERAGEGGRGFVWPMKEG